MFIGFFSSRILLNQLGVQDFGIFNVIAGLLIILGFLNTTLTLSTQRFLNFALGEESKEKAQKVFCNTFFSCSCHPFICRNNWSVVS